MRSFAKKGQLLAILGLAVIGTMALAQPANAYVRHVVVRHDRWHDHEVAARHYRSVHVIPQPGVIYAPPPVVYAPPPPPPGINLVIPLDFR